LKTIYESFRWHEARITGHAAAQHIPLKYAEAGTNGPRATLVAGTHGDEGPWSALAIKMLCEHAAGKLTGRLRVIFTANALAAEVERRNSWIDSPNAIDLDGVFPGDAHGSHTNRLAAALAPLIADSDAVIDLHGGGTWCVNAFVKQFEGSEQLAADIGAPFITKAPNKPGGLTTYARSLGLNVVNVEVGGRCSKEMAWAERNTRGLERALHRLGVLAFDAPPSPAEPAIHVSATEAVRARVGGIFVPTLRDDAVGGIVPGGTEMGKVLDLHTLAELEVFTAPYAQTAMLLLRPQICTIEGSALMYVLAKPA
jgi:predicted deacylase